MQIVWISPTTHALEHAADVSFLKTQLFRTDQSARSATAASAPYRRHNRVRPHAHRCVFFIQPNLRLFVRCPTIDLNSMATPTQLDL